MKRNNIFCMALLIAIIASVAVILIGTLAIPVILSLMYSWYWIFLYAGYLIMVLYVALYCARYWNSDNNKSGGAHR